MADMAFSLRRRNVTDYRPTRQQIRDLELQFYQVQTLIQKITQHSEALMKAAEQRKKTLTEGFKNDK